MIDLNQYDRPYIQALAVDIEETDSADIEHILHMHRGSVTAFKPENREQRLKLENFLDRNQVAYAMVSNPDPHLDIPQGPEGWYTCLLFEGDNIARIKELLPAIQRKEKDKSYELRIVEQDGGLYIDFYAPVDRLRHEPDLNGIDYKILRKDEYPFPLPEEEPHQAKPGNPVVYLRTSPLGLIEVPPRKTGPTPRVHLSIGKHGITEKT